jgi:hypothetical protein
LADQEQRIKDLGGNRTLTSDLRAAYTKAIRALMKQAALLFQRPEADLYRENSGRIPVWAWLQPHFIESGVTSISTPIPEGLSSNPMGEVKFKVHGVDVTIKPDSPNPRITGAETRIGFIPGDPIVLSWAGNKVLDFTPPTPAAVIQTFFGPGATATSTSATGRGTTKEDVAGGRVTPHSTSLGFHEGHHGLDFVEFLESNQLPAFTGKTSRSRPTASRSGPTEWNHQGLGQPDAGRRSYSHISVASHDEDPDLNSFSQIL